MEPSDGVLTQWADVGLLSNLFLAVLGVLGYLDPLYKVYHFL